MQMFWNAIRAWLPALCALALAGCGGGDVRLTGDAGQGAAPLVADTFAANLTAEAQIPASTSGGQGAATVTVDPDSRRMVAVLVTSGVVGTAASLREGNAGVVGPIAFALTESPPGSGVWTTTAALSDDQLERLRDGGFYLEVASLSFPEGELRGQLAAQSTGPFAGTAFDGLTSGDGLGGTGASGVPAPGFGAGTAAPLSFAATLRGDQAVPPNPSTAQGSGSVTINPATRQIAAAVATVGMAPTGAEIRSGAPGTIGTIALSLAPSGGDSSVWLARANLSEQQFNDLLAGTLYFNVRSAAFPEGELRGQLLVQQAGTGTGFSPSTPAEAGLPTFGGTPGFTPPTPGLPTIGTAPGGVNEFTVPTPGLTPPGLGTTPTIGTGLGSPTTGLTPGLGTTPELGTTPGIGATPGFGSVPGSSIGITPGIGGTVGIGGTTGIGVTGMDPGSGIDTTTVTTTGTGLSGSLPGSQPPLGTTTGAFGGTLTQSPLTGTGLGTGTSGSTMLQGTGSTGF